MTQVHNARRTFTVNHGDQRPNLADLKEVDQSHPYANESAIVWFEEARTASYVRVLNLKNCRNRDGSVMLPSAGKVVGYAQLERGAQPDASTGRFTRRVFYLMAKDAATKPGDDLPRNAVDPRRIGPRLLMERVTATRQHASSKAAAADNRGAGDVLSQTDIDTLLENEIHSGGADTGIDPAANSAAAAKLAKKPAREEMGVLDPIGGGDPVPLLKAELVVGRASRNDIVLAFKSISARHCVLTLDSGYWFVEDTNSTNGVKINGNKIEPQSRRRLDPGAEISIGKRHHYVIRYSPEALGSDGIPPAEEVSREFMGVSLLNRIGAR